ncbi:hypothetical protein B0H10DRAFT_1228070 [Mycena sp. CBHHK59/15]|nr:hypothetical protein B0H10DRAFT_1228070 [Mycena sp. CBHHK59/15]
MQYMHDTNFFQTNKRRKHSIPRFRQLTALIAGWLSCKSVCFRPTTQKLSKLKSPRQAGRTMLWPRTGHSPTSYSRNSLMSILLESMGRAESPSDSVSHRLVTGMPNLKFRIGLRTKLKNPTNGISWTYHSFILVSSDDLFLACQTWVCLEMAISCISIPRTYRRIPNTTGSNVRNLCYLM